MGQPNLTTLGAVTRAIRDFPPDDEVKIAEWIESASALIREETGRDFRAPSEVVELTLPTYQGSRVYVPELLSRGDVETVTDDYGTARTYRWSQPHQHKGKGSYLIITPLYNPRTEELPAEYADHFLRNFTDDYRPNPYGNEITVRARVGYDTIPPQINTYCEVTVRRWYYRIQNVGHSIEREESGTPGEHLPPSVLSGLASWKLPRRQVLVP